MFRTFSFKKPSSLHACFSVTGLVQTLTLWATLHQLEDARTGKRVELEIVGEVDALWKVDLDHKLYLN